MFMHQKINYRHDCFPDFFPLSFSDYVTISFDRVNLTFISGQLLVQFAVLLSCRYDTCLCTVRAVTLFVK